MLVPLSWLTDFTPLGVSPEDETAVADLAATFDSLGLVTEAITRAGEGLDDVVLARVLAIEPIEGADRIRQVLVDDGGDEPARVVCGAFNFAVGDVVPLARVGATLPGGVVIGRRKMRGVVSNGMLCSPAELGLDVDASGILIVAPTGAADAPLPPGLVLGAALRDHLGLVSDVVFDLAVEPNRPDALSIAGIARDVAARRRLSFEIPSPKPIEEGEETSRLASLAIDDEKACPRFVARVLVGCAPCPSEPTVARRLSLSGMRPINAVVDASNYVMLELGQPSHPYDLDRLGGGGLRVRFARRGESLVTLDGTSHELFSGSEGKSGDLVICDADDVPVGLAGVMGGVTSEIGDDTSRVLLEVAQFEPLVVGQAAARHGLRTEASLRFWRGVDPEGLERAADRVVELVQRAHRAAGLPAPRVAPEPLVFGPVSRRRRVELQLGELNGLLGTTLSAEEVASYLAPIGFVVVTVGDSLEVEIPSFRPDAARPVDVIEEVARHYGYERIGRTRRRSPFVGRLSSLQRLRRSVRDAVASFGSYEVWTPSLVDPASVAPAGAVPSVSLVNPIAPDESALRPGLLSGLLAVLRSNAGHRNGELRLFEVGRVFRAEDELGPQEDELVGVLLGRKNDDARTAVRLLRLLGEHLLIEPGALRLLEEEAPLSSSLFGRGCHPTRSRLVGTLEHVVGAVGEVDPKAAAAFSLEGRRLGWLVLDLTLLDGAPRRPLLARRVSRFPSSELDLSFVLREEVPASRLESALLGAAGEEAEWVRLVDVYRGPGIPESCRSLTFSIRFCALDHTLDEKELRDHRDRLIAAAAATVSAELRT